MSAVLLEDIKQLLDADPGTCVSIYMPTYQSGREVQQNHIRFKNLLAEARQLAEERDASGAVNKRLKQLKPLIEDDDFWQHQSLGLAIFVNPDSTQIMSVPNSFQERVSVGDRHHVLSLMPLLQKNGIYYVVAVSKNECKLYIGSQESLSEVSADLPDSLEAVIGDQFHKGFGLHSFRVRPSTNDSAVPHGHVEENEAAELERYFREINESVTEAIPDSDSPLIFAGVEEHFPVYKEVNTHEGLQGDHIHGNPDDLSIDELHKKSWKILSKVHEERIDELISQIGDAKASELYSEDLEEIAKAAEIGRVETLIADLHKDSNRPTDVNNQLEMITATVLQTGGEVIVVDQEKLNGQHVVALMRYPAPSEMTV